MHLDLCLKTGFKCPKSLKEPQKTHEDEQKLKKPRYFGELDFHVTPLLNLVPFPRALLFHLVLFFSNPLKTLLY